MSGEKLDDYYNFDKNDNGNKCTNQQIKGQQLKFSSKAYI